MDMPRECCGLIGPAPRVWPYLVGQLPCQWPLAHEGLARLQNSRQEWFGWHLAPPLAPVLHV